MKYEEARKFDARDIQEMGYDVGETCRVCLENYGTPCCDGSDGEGDCHMLDDLHQMLVVSADAGKGN